MKIKFLIAFCLFSLIIPGASGQIRLNQIYSLADSTFSSNLFLNPSIEYAPYARWWWPANAVTKAELKREINLFADHGFGGVEIQPLNLGIPMSRGNRTEILSWDTPEYYENLIVVLKEALKRGLKVDLTNGSGWPPGGPYLDTEDGFLSLNHADTLVEGGQRIEISVPALAKRAMLSSRLQAVLAVKVLLGADKDNSATIPLDASSITDLSDMVELDIPGGDIPEGAFLINKYENRNLLRWDVPEGSWKIIAFWAVPSGERTMIAASSQQGPVVDHLDSTKVLKNYNHLLGGRTGLEPYFGNPLRAIFNDSYEFKADRHYSFDFFNWFKQYRGYDIVPWLPANMQHGYNMVEFMNPHAAPDFKYSDQDWRIRYDYDLTIGELLGEHFFKTTREYLESRGMLHRTQPYGLNMDMMGLAGMASIPETESMNGSEAKLKLTTSGGHLYNRPVISAESVVFINKAYTTTPQMIRLAVDKLFAAGVNQIVYHGIPYYYQNEKIGNQGWYPFSSPLVPYVNFSSNLGESNPYWKYQKEINEYIARTQYLLRLGKPVADVLIYYPFLNFSGFADNPDEIFTTGMLEKRAVSNEEPKDPQAKMIKNWSEKVWPIINQLERNGITWEWVNDASLQIAEITNDKQIDIRGNIYKALIFPEVPYIQIESVKQISILAEKGLNLLVYGAAPIKQPSFLNWQENDQKTEEYIRKALAFAGSKQIRNNDDFYDWIESIKEKCPVQFSNEYLFTRQLQRDLNDGSRVQFIWNKSDSWQEISFDINDKFEESYWLNAENATLIKNVSEKRVRYNIPPYSSVILLASTRRLELNGLNNFTELDSSKAQKFLTIEKWNISVDSLQVFDSNLFDWKTKDEWKYQSAIGKYSASFMIDSLDNSVNYFIDLGEVNHAVDLSLNDQFVGSRYNTPFVFNLSNYIKQGQNTIHLTITPTLLNGFIGKANAGDKAYRQFYGKG